MEIRAYLVGLARKWWLIAIIVLVMFEVGGIEAQSLPSLYTASSTVLLNDSLLASMAVPSAVVRINTPASYVAAVEPPAVQSVITKHYPRLTTQALAKEISVSVDSSGQVLLISVTDRSPAAGPDIANYLAHRFVRNRTDDLNRQLDVYQTNLQQTVSQLTTEINSLNAAIQQLTPPPQRGGPSTLPPSVQQTIAQDQSTVDRDERVVYEDQQALLDIQRARPLFQHAYVILQPASVSTELVIPSLPEPLVRLIAVSLGLLLAIALVCAIEYLTPVVRYAGEIQRVVKLPVLASLPDPSPRTWAARAGILASRRKRADGLRVVTNLIGAISLKDDGQVLLITSVSRQRRFASMLAVLLAQAGYDTLFVDARYDGSKSGLDIPITGPCARPPRDGLSTLDFVGETAISHLWVLPAKTLLPGGEPLTAYRLGDLLPRLRPNFNIIVLDAPPLDHADARLLAPLVSRLLLLVMLRRDTVKSLRDMRSLCEQLRIEPQCVVLS